MKTTPRTPSFLSLVLLGGFSIFASPLAHGQINYQGRLTDAAGAPLNNGPTDISFSLYDSITAGTKLWGPYNLSADLVDGGRFNAVIGNLDTGGNSLTSAMAVSTTHYLEITVGGDAPITPRQVILASPRALKADVIPNVTPSGSNTSITGNVGIGTTNPEVKLHVDGGRLRVSQTGSSGVLELQSDDEKNFIFTDTSGDLLLYTGGAKDILLQAGGGTTGKVGVGTATPTAKLDVAGTLHVQDPGANTGNILVGAQASAAGSPKLIKFGDSDYVHVGESGADDTLELKGTRISMVGRVGIGTANPTRGKLEVTGTQRHTYNIGGFLNRNGASDLNNTNLTRDVGIYSDGIIVGVEVHANSDARIKNVLGRSDGAADLADLNRIEITNYTHKDAIARGDAISKKVIAQQVEKVLPQVVNQQINVVPDIYRRAEFQDGWVKLSTNLKKGERVRLIGDHKEAVHEVLEVAQDKFRVDFVADARTVFVYGREVNDFRTVDYDALSMLNVSATQELARQLKISQENFAKLQEENVALKARLAQQSARDEAIEARLVRLEQSGPRPADAIQVSMKK